MAAQIKSYQTDPANHGNAAEFVWFDIMSRLLVRQRLSGMICVGMVKESGPEGRK